MTIRVVLKPLRSRLPGGLPAWAVMFDGRTIIPRAHDPEHEAARWLRDHGYAGPMETVRQNGTVGMRYADLVRTAEWSISDRAAGGFIRRRHRPWSVETPTRQHPSDAGRPRARVPVITPLDTGQGRPGRVRRDVSMAAAQRGTPR